MGLRLGEYPPIPRVIVYSGQFLGNYKSSPYICAGFSTVKYTYVLILAKKLGWVTFWDIFSQTLQFNSFGNRLLSYLTVHNRFTYLRIILNS
jgi:hypothetical protein